jgi:hypothetical protein
MWGGGGGGGGVCKYVCVCIYVWVCVYVCICVCMYVCVYVCLCVFMYSCMYVICVYVCMRLCIYSCMYVRMDETAQVSVLLCVNRSGCVPVPYCYRTYAIAKSGFRSEIFCSSIGSPPCWQICM